MPERLSDSESLGSPFCDPPVICIGIARCQVCVNCYGKAVRYVYLDKGSVISSVKYKYIGVTKRDTIKTEGFQIYINV